ncbi:hypothetical protein [Desulfotruncus alcoholivorax]|uniref:hypothetical protein n=1 Tax=Desulfotruncus alcoholivorax TaxID=265477 RepID=UPI001EE5E23B|nr:hypothetical protein [Desulfotruncus alcoholivorax]
MPLNEYELSPVNSTVDIIKRRLNMHFTGGEKQEIFHILNRSVKDVLKTGVITGAGLALLAFLISFKFIGPFSAVLCLISLILGVFLTEKLLQNEYRKWQSNLLDGIPTLVSFMPSFLEVEGVTPREAFANTVPFLPNPLKDEMWNAVDRIKRTGAVRESMDAVARKAKHPLVDAICFRMSAAWDAKVTADIFTDLNDQIADINEMAAARATTAKTGYLALVCVIGLVGLVLIFGYPGVRFLLDKMTASFV